MLFDSQSFLPKLLLLLIDIIFFIIKHVHFFLKLIKSLLKGSGVIGLEIRIILLLILRGISNLEVAFVFSSFRVL